MKDTTYSEKAIIVIQSIRARNVYLSKHDLTHTQKSGFTTYEIQRADTADPTLDLKQIITSIQKEVDDISKMHKRVFFITHSSGAEILYRLTLPLNTIAASLWSPSFFVPQNVSATLNESPENNKLLIVEEVTNSLISKKLAHDLDALHTEINYPELTVPHQVILAKDDPRWLGWKNVSEVPYFHNYTSDEISKCLENTVDWFQQTERS